MTPLVPPSVREKSALPVVALVFSVLGFCFPPFLIVGIVLGIIALVQAKGSQAIGIVSVVLPVVAIPVVGILAAIAIPNFIKFQARSKQSEAKANLRAAYQAQKAYFAENQKFDLHPATVGFQPERGNRYLYAFAKGGPFEPNTGSHAKDAMGVGIDTVRYPTDSDTLSFAAVPPELATTIGITGECPKCDITMVAAGNIDKDSSIDVWSVSSADRPGAPAGTPFNDVSDIDK